MENKILMNDILNISEGEFKDFLIKVNKPQPNEGGNPLEHFLFEKIIAEKCAKSHSHAII